MKLTQVTDALRITSASEKPSGAQDRASSKEYLGPKEVYLRWEAVARPRSKEVNERFLRTFTVIGIVVVLLLLLIKEFFLILVVGSLIFISRALAQTPPEKAKYELNSHGVLFDGKPHYWRDMTHFFFKHLDKMTVLVMDTKVGMPPRLFISINPKDEEKIKEICEKYVLFLEEEPKTIFDKAYDSFLDKFKFTD